MLNITLSEIECFDNVSDCFIIHPTVELALEHTLVTISKWESKWLKPFLSDQVRSDEETLDYISCMSSKKLDMVTLSRLSQSELIAIREYIQAPMTATVINNSSSKGGKTEIITSELIYYWMVALNIPWECQNWHLNRLLILINVCNIKNSPGKKMSRQEVMSKNAELNAARKKAMNTSG